MNAHKIAENLFSEAIKLGMVNPITGDGLPSSEMVADAIHDAYENGKSAVREHRVVTEINRQNRVPQITAHNMPGVKELIRRANMDTDHATFFWLGDHESTADGAIVVIRGNDAARLAAAHLENVGLYRPHLVCPNEPRL